MSTADCKELLVRIFPKTLGKDWKREKKFVNHQQIEVRIFRHPQLGPAYVIEDDDEVSLDGTTHDVQQVSALRAGDYLVWAKQLEPGCIHAFVVHKGYFAAHGQAEDAELAVSLAAFFPKQLKHVDELEGGCFRIRETSDQQAVMTAFLDSGFGHSEAFSRHIEREYS
jgi:hypothetical protein